MFVFISVCYAMAAQWALWYIDQSLRTHSFRYWSVVQYRRMTANTFAELITAI